MMKLDIGCGGRGTYRVGFIGTDVLPTPTNPVRPSAEYVQLDFVNDELPWVAETFDEIVAAHIIEHLTRPKARLLIHRALHLLEPGGTLLISTPDLRRLCTRYIENDTAFFSWEHKRPGNPVAWPGHTIGDKLNWIIHEYGHLWMYDDISLLCLIREAGCSNARPIPNDCKQYTARGHDFGFILTATGDEKITVTSGSSEAERRMADWDNRTK